LTHAYTLDCLPFTQKGRIAAENGQVALADTHQLGLYRVSWEPGFEAGVAVNLFAPQESDIAPADSLPLGGAEAGEAAAGAGQARREWWRPLALLALLVLMVEWFIYQRAALARLRDEIKSKLARSSKTVGRRFSR
jgi:hypothetical protein